MEKNQNEEPVVICEIGGSFDENIISLIFDSEKLNRQRITELLGVSPSDAWNPGEPHVIGNKGETKIHDFGKWILDSTRDNGNINDKIINLLSQCTNDLEKWKKLSEENNIYLLIVGHLENWNRGFNINIQALKMMVERNIELSVDVYFWGNEE